ncbi:hypothetical protein E5Q_01180 [Mixia osmundae IAM 14324]|uniref:Vacuolar import/degradation Vid27 C-terminal domain-containing protein n=1 Tax=Mixia osmundae (strain CBS 9802 / IAM 14324 / JCM 22182 / KY 12970) TaxID=764103 RepID=G7DVB8_MIXOS|nr:hypothetical protein E5Q_01180 [Mixia osmundae IAM 14324]
MFLFKSLLGNPAQTEVVSIPGRFFVTRPQGLKGSKECIYQDAVASIRRTSREYNWSLVVTKSWGQDGEQLLSEEEETDDERPYLIDAEIAFASAPTRTQDQDDGPSTSFTWRDLSSGDVDEVCLFVCRSEGTRPETLLLFESLVYRAMYERQYSRSADHASEANLESYKRSSTLSRSAQQPLFRPPSSDEEDDDVSSQLANVSLSGPPASTRAPPVGAPPDLLAAGVVGATPRSSKGKGRASEIEPAPSAADTRDQIDKAVTLPPDRRNLISSETADLNLYDAATGVFMPQEKAVQASLWLVQGQKFPCWLTISGAGGRTWVSLPVDDQMPAAFNEDSLSFVFNYNNVETNQFFTWLLRLPDKESLDKLSEAFTRAFFEARNGAGQWAKLKTDEQRYSQDALIEDLDMYEPTADDEREAEAAEEDEKYEQAEEEQAQESDAALSDESEDESDAVSKPVGAKVNKLLAVGHKEEMSFVVRGDQIGVFRSNPEGRKKLKFVTNIQGISTPDGKRLFEPSKVMLHNQDATMVLADPMNPNSLYKLDLATGRVVDEWKISDNMAVHNFAPGSKFAPTTAEQTFVGMSRNGLFMVDPRLSGSKLVESQFKQYATKTDFAAAATTGSGHIAVVSDKGDIRLFDSLGKNAKTALPALGDAIKGVDTTADGRFVLATCKDYLLLIDTTIKDGKYAGQSGFERSFPAAAKPMPRRLQPKLEHRRFIGDVNFTVARFNAGLDSKEQNIITSTGDFVIIWDFKKVQKGKLDSYIIKRVGETIVADNFVFGKDNELVIASHRDVFQEVRQSLVKPTRESLAPTPRKARAVVKHYDADEFDV